MSRMLDQEKPSLEELSEVTAVDRVLEHHGVKGMKWGQRKFSSGEIHDARARVGSQVRQINRQIDKANLAATPAQQKRESAKLSKMLDAHSKNPDRAISLRMTKGEKYANGIIAVAAPGVGTAAVALGVGIRVAQRKKTEQFLSAHGIGAPASKLRAP